MRSFYHKKLSLRSVGLPLVLSSMAFVNVFGSFLFRDESSRICNYKNLKEKWDIRNKLRLNLDNDTLAFLTNEEKDTNIAQLRSLTQKGTLLKKYEKSFQHLFERCGVGEPDEKFSLAPAIELKVILEDDAKELWETVLNCYEELSRSSLTTSLEGDLQWLP